MFHLSVSQLPGPHACRNCLVQAREAQRQTLSEALKTEAVRVVTEDMLRKQQQYKELYSGK